MAGRLNGRRPGELRPVRIQRRYTKHAEGSVLVEFGDTRVLCTASVEERVPPFLKDSGRVSYVSATDEEAVRGFYGLSREEGILPALESSHAVAFAETLAPKMKKGQILVVNVSGRGDKDIGIIQDFEKSKGSHG